MYDERERSFAQSFDPSWASSTGTPHPTRWVAWMPLLFVAAFLYWSVALGLGGLSLMAASAISGDLDQGPELAPSVMEPAPGHTLGEPIVIRLEESVEPEDVNDNAGAVTPSDDNDDGTGRLPGQSRN
jgi:hypothetical protein